MTAEILKWIGTVLASVAVGGAVTRWIIPTTRKLDEASTAQAEAVAVKSRAEARKVAAEEVNQQVAAVTDALTGLRETLKAQREEFTARDRDKTEELTQLKGEVRMLRALFRSYVTFANAYAAWARPAIDGWRSQVADYPEPPTPPDVDQF